MGITHLSGLEVAGVPTIGTGGLLPFTGNYYFVNETTGSDGNTGAADNPFKTLTQALAKATAGNNDVIFLTGTVHTTATTNWSKNNVHLIGLSAPSDNDRARISQTGTTLFTPLVNVTAQGCIFANIGTFHGFASANTQICWAEAGGRNYYQSVQFLGMGNATAAAQAGSRSLTVAGAGENLFVDCTVGLDTITRATNANASLEFLAGTPRNTFRNCLFQMLTSLATDVHVTVGADGLDRYALFDNCSFINAVESTSTTINAAITANAAAGGAILVQNGLSLGATAIATTGPVYGVGAVPTAATSNIAIKLT
jgi:hypothetical protein